MRGRCSYYKRCSRLCRSCGVPARIIRYRYEPDEIAALNRIAWWDWPDEKIRKNYNDFYLDIKEFIKNMMYQYNGLGYDW